ncbi:MAG TPA: hypothetical protein VFS00_27950, partial [Polyangiaceae bacterium]|nr:hypothetical protein [Polyangiaceae bacterium]
RFARPRRLGHAYVVFDRHRRAALEIVLPFLAEHGIDPAGRYGSWTYASMEDALVSGRLAARSALAAGGAPP